MTGRSESYPLAPITEGGEQPALLIVVDQRDFIRGCLSCWLSGFCSEFQVVAVPAVETSIQAEMLQRAAVAIVGTSAAMLSDGWLNDQIGWLRVKRAALPIVLIVDNADASGAEALIDRLGLQGYILTSSRTDLAAAAVRLIAAGGSYAPRSGLTYKPLTQESAPNEHPPDPVRAANFTPREQAVVSLLCHGMPNKIIADRLGISLQTVKVHIHNIIRKLKVRNRTEVVVALRLLPAVVRDGNAPTETTASSTVSPGPK